jgi:ribonuclease D
VHRWIDRPDELAQRLADWRDIETLALDTEFIRERTWWPRLALVQITVPEHEALLVDPTIPGIPELLRPLIADPAITKIMHSAGEDVQALQRGCGALPSPLFDTQIAAALCGVGAGMGYQRMVEALLGIALPKSQTRSDWLQRPLSHAQLMYAADDVAHLHALHAILREKLRESGREAWLAEDCARLLVNASNEAPELYPHLALRGAQYLDAAEQALLCRLLRWREAQARANDRPKGWILDNELALALARRPPSDSRAFHAFLDSQPKAPRKLRGELWNELSRPLNTDDREVPLAQAPGGAQVEQKQALSAMQDAVAAETRRLNLADGVLATRRALEAVLDGNGWPESLQGWRKTILEPLLRPIVEGTRRGVSAMRG